MTRDKENLIALFIDYDNIAIGLKETTGKPFEVRTVLERLLEKGRIIYKRAYADWYLFSEGKHALHEHAIEMIDIPMRRNIGKNSADIRLVVDALDLCYTKEHIETFVIGSGDSDFTPLVSKLKENDKRVIGFGLAQSTSNLLANNCDEFIFYEDLVSLPVNRPQLPVGLSKRQFDGFSLLLDAVAALMRENKDVLWGSLIKDAIRRKRPSFSEGQFGYSSFSMLLEDAAKHQLIGLIKDPRSGGTPVVTGFGIAGDLGEGGTTSGTSAAPSGSKGPSLIVNSAGARFPSSSQDTETETKKPARRSPRRRSTARKPAVAKKVEEVKETAAPDAPAETTSGAATVETETKKPVRRSTRRRSTAKPKPKAETSSVETPELVELAEVKPGEEATPDAGASKTVRKPSPRKSASRKTTATPRSEGSKTAVKPDDKADVKAEAKPVVKETAAVEKEEPKLLPKGKPLRTRVHRRRR